MEMTPEQAEEDPSDVTAFLEQAVLTAQVTGEIADQGLLDHVERLRGVEDWREVQLPEALVRRIEDYESRHGRVSLIHYLHAVDNEPVLVLAQAEREAKPEETVVFSYSETTVTAEAQEAVTHTLICRRDG